jgi:ubiquitin-protein ligase
MATSRRVQKEFEDFSKAQNDTQYGVSAELVGNDITHWKGVVKGP